MDHLSAALSLLLILSGVGLLLLEKQVSEYRQHYFAFLGIGLILLSMIPRLGRSPEILICSGMVLFALHLSTYYSGTPQNSGRLYGLILLITGLVPLLPILPQLQTLAFGRFVLSGLVWYLMGQLESQLSKQHRSRHRLETSLLWIWFITASWSLFDHDLQILPDLLFILILVVHIETAWGDRHVPAPMVVFYGLLLSWNLHFIFGLEQLRPGLRALSATEGRGLAYVAGILLLWRIYQTRSLSKKFMYFYLLQEMALLRWELSSWFLPADHIFDLIRFLIFAALIGLFVMIESRASEPLEQKLLRGIGHERLRLTLLMLSLALFMGVFPLAYWWVSCHQLLPMLMLVLLGIFLSLDLMRISFQAVKRDFRIIRPSLSIWSTVILTIIWASLILIRTLYAGSACM